MNAVELSSGDISLPSLNLTWPDLEFKKHQITLFSGSPNAPISDFFFFLAGLQEARRVTGPAPKGRLNREVVSVPRTTLLKLKYQGLPIYESTDTDRASKIGFIFNDPELSMVGSTAREDIDHAFAAVGMPNPSLSICKKYGFTSEKLIRRVDVLSGGELHRLLCLIGVEKAPEVLFVDLTRSNLDHDFLEELCLILKDLAIKGCCIFAAGIDLEWLPTNVNVLHVEDSGVILHGARVAEPSMKMQESELSQLLVPRKIPSEVVLETFGLCRTGITIPISFSMKRGEIVMIYGPNGCGKTTLGLILAGRCKEADYSGKPRMPKEVTPVMALQHAARAFVEESLYDEYPDPEYWATLGFSTEQIHCHPRAIGYGMQKLAACALALKRAKGLCILDEPTCGMDYNIRKKFIQLLGCFPETAILVFTHDSTLRSIGRLLNYGEMEI